jgi:DNA gyrase subunit B
MAVKKVQRKTKAVKEAQIEAKDQRWHCRNRVTLVFGSNDVEDLDTYLYEDGGVEFQTVKFHQAKSKAIEEILDNCIDEFYRGHVTEIHTSLSEDERTVKISDNGIGFPLDKVQMVYTEFRTGSKFKDEEVDDKGYLYRTLGQNGLGAAATCLTSDLFRVGVKHYNSGKEQTFTFHDGALKTTKTRAKPFKGASGVTIELQLAKEVYKDPHIDGRLLRKRIIDLAYNNPGLAFFFNGEKFLFEKGLFELAKRIEPEQAQCLGDQKYTFEGLNAKKKKVKALIDIHVSLCFDRKTDDREKFISFVNSTPTYDGGFHHDRIKRLFVNAIKAKLEKAAKKEKATLNDNDILSGMTFVIGVIMPNPRFESQTKRKLVRDSYLEKAIEKFIDQHIDKFLRKNKDMLEVIMERARNRNKFLELKEASKKARKQKKQRVEKLLDANERRDRSKCTLFICEGDSAIGGLRSSRDKQTQGGIAIRGKPMNVAQASIKDILANQEFMDITASVGLVIGQEIDKKKLRYSKIVFLADSDVDGGHINTLLTNFFFQFWPEMFTEGMIKLAKAPLFEVHTERGVVYAETPQELEKIKNSGKKIKEIHRNKGLGEMSPEAWKYVMTKEFYTTLSVDDASEAKDILHVCFGKDTQLRKDLLLDESSSNEVETPLVTDPQNTNSSQNSAKKASSARTSKATSRTVKGAGQKAKKKAAKKVSKKTKSTVSQSSSKKKAKKTSKKRVKKRV